MPDGTPNAPLPTSGAERLTLSVESMRVSAEPQTREGRRGPACFPSASLTTRSRREGSIGSSALG